MKYFGFFKGMEYGKCDENFETYINTKNQLNKSEILKYIKSLPVAAVAPLSVSDIFTGQPLEQAGLIEDGDFCFPIDFIHYYGKYDIGIPHEYEKYLQTKILN